MEKHKVTVFKMYEFEVGQKITIADGPRAGDWLVIGVDDKKVRLRCPVSHMEFEWSRFCCHVENREQDEWPVRD